MDSKESHQESGGNKQSLLPKLEQAQQENERLKQQQSMRSSKSQRSIKSSKGGLEQTLMARKMEEMRLENERLIQQQSMRSSKSQRSIGSSQDGQYQSLLAQMEQMRLENEQLKQQQSMRSSKSQQSTGSLQVSAAKTIDGLVPSSYQPPSDNPENMEHNTKNIPLYRQFYGVPIREIDYGSDDFWVEPSYNPYAVKRQPMHQFPVQPRHSAPEEKVEEPVEILAKHHQVQEPTIIQDKHIMKLDKFISNQKFYYSHFSSKKLTRFNPVTDQIPVIKELTFGERQDKEGKKVDLDEILRKHEDDIINDVITIIGDHGSGKSLTSAACADILSRNQKKVVKIGLHDVNLKKSIHFPHFLISIGLQEVNYDKSKEHQYNEYFLSHQNSIAIILENIDSLLTDIGKYLPYTDTTEMATPITWIKQLLGRKILKFSTIVVISLPSSILYLEKLHRPNKMYKISGYDEKMMKKYLSQNKQASKILEFVNSQNTSIQALARFPSNLARLAQRIGKVPIIFESFPTEIEMYEIFLSIIKPRNNEIVCRKIVEFYYNLLKQGKSSFISEDLKHEDLSVKDIAENSMLSASYIDDGNQIEYRPSYPSLMDYSISVHIEEEVGEKEFKEILETKLFSSVDDAMWRNVRNFLSNRMFQIVSTKDKLGLRIGTLLEFGETSLVPRNVIEKYEKIKKEELCHLREKIRKFSCWEDMEKNPMNGEQMELIADAINNYNDSETIEKMTSIKKSSGTKFSYLKIKLASKQECASNTKQSQIFSRFMEAMEKLTKKIRDVYIHNFTHEYKMEDLSNIIEKCGRWMFVHYDDDEEDEVVQQMDQRLQDVCSKLPRKGSPRIFTHHQYRQQFIKQLSPVMTSSYESMIFDHPNNSKWKLIQLPSVPCDDDLLRKLANHINGETFYFRFFISDRNEVTNLVNLMKHLKRWIVSIGIYFPRNTTRSETKLFANAITEFSEKIGWINIFNLTSNNIDDKDLLKIAPKVGGSLYSEDESSYNALHVYFTDNQSDDVKSALVKKLESLWQRPTIFLHFRDDVRIINKSFIEIIFIIVFYLFVFLLMKQLEI